MATTHDFSNTRKPLIFPWILKNRIFLILNFFLFIYLFIGFDMGMNVYDEGITNYETTRVMAGEIPYKDFWFPYTPGQFYFLAMLFKVFGTSIWVERVWSVVGEFLMSIMIYFVGRRLYSENLAIGAEVVMVIWIGGLKNFYGYVIPWSIFFSLLSMLFFMKFISERNKSHLFLSGLITGVTIFFRHDIGFYMFASQILVLGTYLLTSIADPKQSLFLRCKFSTSIILRYYALGILAIVLPAALYLVSVVPLNDLIYDLITLPLIYSKMAFLSFPDPLNDILHLISNAAAWPYWLYYFSEDFAFFFPLTIFLIVLLIYLAKVCKNKIDLKSPEIWNSSVMILLGILFFNHAKNRADLPHYIAPMAPAIILSFLILEKISSNFKEFRVFRRATVFLFFVLYIAILWAPLWTSVSILTQQRILAQSLLTMKLPRANGLLVSPSYADYQQAIKYVQKKVPKKEKIFVGLTHHDKINTNDVMFYFLAERGCATKFDNLCRGVATSRKVQEQIIRDIRKNNVNCIVLWDYFFEEPNDSNKSSGVKLLDNFIRNNYNFEKQFGPYYVFGKKGF